MTVDMRDKCCIDTTNAPRGEVNGDCPGEMKVDTEIQFVETVTKKQLTQQGKLRIHKITPLKSAVYSNTPVKRKIDKEVVSSSSKFSRSAPRRKGQKKAVKEMGSKHIPPRHPVSSPIRADHSARILRLVCVRAASSGVSLSPRIAEALLLRNLYRGVRRPCLSLIARFFELDHNLAKSMFMPVYGVS